MSTVPSWGQTAMEANWVMTRYIELVYQETDLRILQVPDELVVADDAHRWGAAPSPTPAPCPPGAPTSWSSPGPRAAAPRRCEPHPVRQGGVGPVGIDALQRRRRSSLRRRTVLAGRGSTSRGRRDHRGMRGTSAPE